MSTHVYANGLEIVCQASDGRASTAFPDPCYSPPGPPAGPVVVPYELKGDSKKYPAKHGGCCLGQTGHHLITDQMVRGGTCPVCDKNNPSAIYKTETGLTVCVEGDSQHHGTHGLVHAKLGDAIQYLHKKKRIKNGMMSFDDAIDVAVKSHRKAFPRSGCSDKCIRAQLLDYYGKACPGAQFAAVDRNGRQYKQDAGSQSVGE